MQAFHTEPRVGAIVAVCVQEHTCLRVCVCVRPAELCQLHAAGLRQTWQRI